MASRFSDILTNFTNNIKALNTYIISAEDVLLKNTDDFLSKNADGLVSTMYLAHKLKDKSDQPFLEYLKNLAQQQGINFTFDYGEVEEEEAIQFVEHYFQEKLPIKKDGTIDKESTINFESFRRIKKFSKASEINRTSNKLLYESMLISSIIYFENVISNCLQCYIEEHPEIISIDNKNLSLAELKLFDTIQDARNYVIEREIQSLMYNNFEGWMDYISKNIKLKTNFMQPYIYDIKKAFLVRNLYVHNGGIINTTFIQKLNDSEEFQTGTKYVLSKDFIMHTVKLLEKSGLLLILNFWRKLKKADNSRLVAFSDFAFEKMEEEDWETAELIYYELIQNETPNASDLLLYRINYCQCLKWQNKVEEFNDVIGTFDFSIYGNIYKLAGYALTDDVDQFIELLPKILENKDITDEELKLWPLFRNMRKEEKVKPFIIEEKEKLLFSSRLSILHPTPESDENMMQEQNSNTQPLLSKN